MNDISKQIAKKRVTQEEVERAHERLAKQRIDDVRFLISTHQGRRVLHWLLFEEGCLQKIVAAEDEGRRRLASRLHQQLDTAQPGCVEEMALEARKTRVDQDAAIASAIANRRSEYE